ncbi:MAG: cysteine desulfurase family protein [Thermosynechococcaceae cyanobacterium]
MPSPDRQRPIYLDHQATTPVDPLVLGAMLPYFTEHPGNPSSTSHLYGWEAEAAVKQARQTLAEAINANPDEIIFTSGATEANNLAIKGTAETYLQKGRHLVTVQTEHNAVIEPCRYLEKLGFEVTYLPIQEQGLIDLQQLGTSLRPDTSLVSVMAANNEIGVLQPLAAISDLCHRHQVILHTDAAQALGKIPLDVQSNPVDLMSLTAHKLYGPKGIGALYIRRGQRISPQLHGGGQEQGWRSGTLATPLIVGFGKAVEVALADLETESQHLSHLRDQLWQQLQRLEGIYLNGHPTEHLPGCLNVSISGVDGTRLVRSLQPYVALSSGSACASAKLTPSHVLTALGRDPQLARASLRFGIGRSNTLDEINQVAQRIIEAVTTLRSQGKNR